MDVKVISDEPRGAVQLLAQLVENMRISQHEQSHDLKCKSSCIASSDQERARVLNQPIQTGGRESSLRVGLKQSVENYPLTFLIFLI